MNNNGMDEPVHPLRAFRLRQRPAMSLSVLAARTATTKATISRIETGKQKITEDLLGKLVAGTGIPARVLRPDLAELFGARRARRRARAA
jgi:transcriptional regulator with XRE-family HTH domain